MRNPIARYELPSPKWLALIVVVVGLVAAGLATGELKLDSSNRPSDPALQMDYDAGYSCGQSMPDIVAKDSADLSPTEEMNAIIRACGDEAKSLGIPKLGAAAIREFHKGFSDGWAN